MAVPTDPGFPGRSGWLNETTGEVSESPYPSRTRSPKASSTPRSTSTGREEPPETPSRTVLVSNEPPSGTRSRAVYIVGTPRKTVTRSRTTTSRACRGSNLGRSVRHEPPATAVFSAQVCPNEWNSGNPPNSTSDSPLPNSVSTQARVFERRLAKLSAAPLGRPVVPEV
jgi:hypothetical protein